MVYLRSMTPVLSVLLLIAGSAEAQSAAEIVPAAAPPVPAAATPSSAAETPAAIPDVTMPQVPAKPAVPREQLKILGQDIRIDAYQQFRALYEAGRFEEALSYAKQVVELTEHGEDPDYELPVAYNNLGATQYQLGDYPAATDSYSKSLDLLEATQGISSRRLVVPLAGLAAVYAAQNQHELAAELYARALAVSRRADGLFNLQQVPLLRQAADSRFAINDFAGAEREHLYALKIAEQNYGYGDPRTIPSLLEFGSFYEGLREYIAARLMYMRARDAALAVQPGFSPEAVAALTGISRCHRLQYSLNPDPAEAQQPQRDEFTGEFIGKVYQEPRVPGPSADRTGLKAAQQALELVRAAPNPPPELVTLALVELGDWFQTLSKPGHSMPYYVEAAALLDGRVNENPLLGHPLREPRMVFYRPPAGAIRRINAETKPHVIRKTVFSFLVTEAGLPEDITVVSSDMNDAQLMLSRRALSRAIYSPRFAEGRAVATAGVTFTGEWYDTSAEAAAEAAAPPAPAEATTPAPAAEPVGEPVSGPGT
jgi:tetratricopeptide (TPR) repeat protein